MAWVPRSPCELLLLAAVCMCSFWRGEYNMWFKAKVAEVVTMDEPVPEDEPGAFYCNLRW